MPPRPNVTQFYWMNLWNEIQSELEARENAGLRRQLRPISPNCLDLASNDYLGLSRHPEVVQAAQNAAAKFGAGARSSRLVSGDYSLIRDLENALAKFKNAESALVFSSGYAANLGAIGALANEKSALFCHKRNHASLLDACRLASFNGASLRFWDNGEKLENLLQNSDSKRKIVVADAVFSMDGDLLDLPEILRIVEKHDAILVLDDAHGTGTLGATGRGIEEHFNIKNERIVLVGTLSKALGSQGGFVVGPQILIDFLVNAARSLIYSTALNPPAVGAALQSLKIIEREPERVQKCRENARFLARELCKRGFDARFAGSPIVPVLFSNANEALKRSFALEKRGFWCPAIRPPTVKTSRLRLTTCASWDEEILARIVDGFVGKH